MEFLSEPINEEIPQPDLDNDDDLLSFEQANNSLNFSYDNVYSFIKSENLKLPYMIIDNVPRITCTQLANLLQDPTSNDYKEVLILDARFPYEYRGGHIFSSQNIISQASFQMIFKKYSKPDVCIICHCEFSKTRGPHLYSLIRNHDRMINKYPKLSIPEMYVLHGGYSQFYEKYPELCLGGYVPMREKKFVENGELKRCHSFYLKSMINPLSFYMKRSLSASIYDRIQFDPENDSNMTSYSFLSKNNSQDSSS